MKENEHKQEKLRCEDCEHFSWGVCDIHGFRYDHEWTCNEGKRKE